VTRVTWDDLDKRLYYSGVDRGMLYVGSDIKFSQAWTGLVSITENPDGGDGQPFYIDGRKHLNAPAGEDYKATLEAFDAPTYFAPCAGWNRLSTGLFAVDQPRDTFSFSYRTMIGSVAAGPNFAYKIHIVMNATAQISNFTHTTTSDQRKATSHSWTITTCPVSVPGKRPSSHFIFDTRLVSPTGIRLIENILYGDDSDDPRLPTVEEIIALLVIPENNANISLKKPAIAGTATYRAPQILMTMKKPHISGTGT
jgi:hypothetical protein